MTHSFNRLTTIAALDIGSSKVCCVIAKISRDKRVNVVGYGYNASKGIKNGVVTDITQATLSVCNAVEAAEQMANERIDRVIVNISGDRVKSTIKSASISINKNRPVNEADINKVIERGINKINVEGHETSLPSNKHCISLLPLSSIFDRETFSVNQNTAYRNNTSLSIQTYSSYYES